MRAAGSTLAQLISATTVYSLNVLVPIKCSTVWPLHEKRDVPSGISPLPCVVRILLQRLVLGLRQNLPAPVPRCVARGTRRPPKAAQLAHRRKPTLAALRDVAGQHMVAGLHGDDAIADALDDPGTLVAQDAGKCALRICGASVGRRAPAQPPRAPARTGAAERVRVRVADTGRDDADADLACRHRRQWWPVSRPAMSRWRSRTITPGETARRRWPTMAASAPACGAATPACAAHVPARGGATSISSMDSGCSDRGGPGHHQMAQ